MKSSGAMIKTETGLLNWCENWLKDEIISGIYCYFLKIWGNPYQNKGQPDILICWLGRYIALELKRPGKIPAPGNKLDNRTYNQLANIARIRKAGGVADMIDSAAKFENILLALARNEKPPRYVEPSDYGIAA